MDSYLSPSSRILRRPTGDEFGVVVLQQVLVQAHVLLLGQDGVVGFHAIFLEELGVSGSFGSVTVRNLQSGP